MHGEGKKYSQEEFGRKKLADIVSDRTVKPGGWR